MGEIEARLKQHPAIHDAVVLVGENDEGLRRTLSKDAESVPDPDILLQEISSWGAAEADRLLTDLEALSEAETAFLLLYETDAEARRNTMIQRFPEFEIFLRLLDKEFIRPPQEHQKHWLLQRALDEFDNDLRHLDAVSRRFVTGSPRVRMQHNWGTSRARYNDTQLVIEDQQVMQAWERPLMQAMADVVTETHGDILEVGFGMGISATYIQERDVRSHTIIEYNDDVVATCQQWMSRYPERDIRLMHGKWQDVVDQLETYDGVFFDAYPLSEDEFQRAILNSITFAEAFFSTAAALLRSGGIFTYFTSEIDSLSRRHQRLIFKYFSSFTLSVVRSLVPPDDCNYWWADSMAVVKAVK